MTTISQFFLQIFAAILVSVVIWVAFSVLLLSSGIIHSIFQTSGEPVSETAFYGLIVGIIHGLLMWGIFFFYETDSTIGSVLSSVAATEITLAIGFVIGLMYFFRDRTMIWDVENVYQLTFSVIFWYIVISILFLIPSIVIGIAKKFLGLVLFKMFTTP